eukprot:CAMPEP_0201224232 /NCGR_PEP_ID=MMETSP0851-20130426/193513_1 /ASSEMBLY_ACC=CAM_ASM_000631 /TAXON_ID=183588 /ORGANISM="Pseudo-nitzschia fraudulenta, Strain WWA7" /LENGTH=91 /DNA_ID=CAMNT_0047513999 /DNA_START=191 /DNA_END=463 /DNA_ORIENTATION=-
MPVLAFSGMPSPPSSEELSSPPETPSAMATDDALSKRLPVPLTSFLQPSATAVAGSKGSPPTSEVRCAVGDDGFVTAADPGLADALSTLSW